MTDNKDVQMVDNKLLMEQVEALKMENRVLKESLRNSEGKFISVIEKLPHAIVAVDRNSRILFCNHNFAEMTSYCISIADVSNKTLVGTDISLIVDEDTTQFIKNALTHSKDILNMDVTMADRRVSLSIYALKREDFCIALFREMYDPQVIKEEIAERIQFVIDRNMSMIQNIGSLLGEETSETTRILNSVIKSL